MTLLKRHIPEFEIENLSQCDQEPIHTPGTIQPHGMLLVFELPNWNIIRVSQNSFEFLNQAPEKVFGQSFHSIFEPRAFDWVKQAVELAKDIKSIPLFSTPVQVQRNQKVLNCIVHQSNDRIIVELESIPIQEEFESLKFSQKMRMAVYKVQRAQSVKELLNIAVQENKSLTGFDRVMIYYFHPDEHGEVIAEAKNLDLDPFLGLHYPASDIPQQARTLYLKNWARIIPDVNYEAVGLYPPVRPSSELPLDLTYSVLRSVPSIHRKYLKNMGVSSSMSVSLVKDERLWGLIAFHHLTPKKFSFKMRSSLEILAQLIVSQIGVLETNEGSKKSAVNKLIEGQLIRKMSISDQHLNGLLQEQSKLLEMTRSEGALVTSEGKVYFLGRTPSREDSVELIDWVTKQFNFGIFYTHSLPSVYEKANKFSNITAGILAISISKHERDLIIWLRPEVIETVNWAGNPEKSANMSSEGVLNPRASFALFKEQVYGKSYPWSQEDLNAARDLRTSILDIVVRKVDKLKELNLNLEKAVRYRDEFLSVASHELKTPLATLQLQLEMILKSMENKKRVNLIMGQLERLNQLIESLLDVSKAESGRFEVHPQDSVNLSTLVETISSKFEDEFLHVGSELRKNITPDIIGRFDPLRIEQVITNLLTNAIKYGNHRPVEITLKKNIPSRVEVCVKDQGIGIPQEMIPKIFDRFSRVSGVQVSRGLGIGLWIAKQIVDVQGGRLWVESTFGKGSTFTVELPFVPS